MRTMVRRIALLAVLTLAIHLLIVFGVANGSAGVRRWFQVHTTIPAVFIQPSGSSTARFREAEVQHDLDLLFIGSSHCYRTFDTRYYSARGWRAFNLGSTSQSPLNSFFLLRRYLPRLHPRLLVVEGYWVMFQQTGAESALDLCGSLPWSRELLFMALATRDPLALNGVLLRLLDLRRPASRAPIPPEEPRDSYVPGGFVERIDPPTRPGRPSEPAVDSVQPCQFRYLRRILRLARTQGVPAMVVMQPEPVEDLDRVTARGEIVRRVREIAAAERVPLIDLNESMRLSREEFFFDQDHLNARGVEMVNRAVLAELDRRGWPEHLPAGGSPSRPQ